MSHAAQNKVDEGSRRSFDDCIEHDDVLLDVEANVAAAAVWSWCRGVVGGEE
jgi:hypothetical protein